MSDLVINTSGNGLSELTINTQESTYLFQINTSKTQYNFTVNTGGPGTVWSVNGKVGDVILTYQEQYNVASWSYVAPYWQSLIPSINITAMDIVDCSVDNSYENIYGLLPQTISVDGGVYIYSQNEPLEDFIITITILKK